MKGLLISGLSSLILGSFMTPVLAGELAMTSQVQNLNSAYLGPVTLVSLARQGFFQDQGIPGHLGLSFAVQSGKIDSEVLVKSAIDAGRLSPDTLNNSTYLSQVDLALSGLDND